MTVVHAHAHEHAHVALNPSPALSYSYASMWSHKPTNTTPGVHAGAGAAALYHRRAHAVRDAQVLWRGNYISHSLMHFVITSFTPRIH